MFFLNINKDMLNELIINLQEIQLAPGDILFTKGDINK